MLEVLPCTSTVNIIRRSPDELGVEDPGEMKEREQKTTLIYQGVDAQGKIVGYAFVGEGNGYGGVVRVRGGMRQRSDFKREDPQSYRDSRFGFSHRRRRFPQSVCGQDRPGSNCHQSRH